MAPSPTRSRGSRARPRATTSTSCARRRGCNPIESRHALPVLAPLGLSSFRSTPRAPPPALRTPPRDHPKTTRTTRASSPVRSPARESPRRRAPAPPSRAPCSPRPRRRRRAPAPPPPPRISPSASPPPSRSAPTTKNSPQTTRERSGDRRPVRQSSPIPGIPGDGHSVPGISGISGTLVVPTVGSGDADPRAGRERVHAPSPVGERRPHVHLVRRRDGERPLRRRR